MSWEINFLNNIQTFLRNPISDEIFKFFTFIGTTPCVIVLLAILLIFKKTRKISIQATAAVVVGLLIGNLLCKNLFARSRPFVHPDAVVTAGKLLVEKPWDYSFPSGHALASFNIAFTFLLNDKKAGIIAICIAFMISFSRMYLFVHYPTDILGGILIACLCSILSFRFVKPLCDQIDLTKCRR